MPSAPSGYPADIAAQMQISYRAVVGTKLNKSVISSCYTADVGGNIRVFACEATEQIKHAAGVQLIRLQRRVDALCIDKASVFTVQNGTVVLSHDASSLSQSEYCAGNSASRYNSRGFILPGYSADTAFAVD